MNINAGTNSTNEPTQENRAQQLDSNVQILSESDTTPANRGRSSFTSRLRSVSLFTRSVRNRIGSITARARIYVSRSSSVIGNNVSSRIGSARESLANGLTRVGNRIRGVKSEDSGNKKSSIRVRTLQALRSIGSNVRKRVKLLRNTSSSDSKTYPQKSSSSLTNTPKQNTKSASTFSRFSIRPTSLVGSTINKILHQRRCKGKLGSKNNNKSTREESADKDDEQGYEIVEMNDHGSSNDEGGSYNNQGQDQDLEENSPKPSTSITTEAIIHRENQHEYDFNVTDNSSTQEVTSQNSETRSILENELEALESSFDEILGSIAESEPQSRSNTTKLSQKEPTNDESKSSEIYVNFSEETSSDSISVDSDNDSKTSEKSKNKKLRKKILSPMKKFIGSVKSNLGSLTKPIKTRLSKKQGNDRLEYLLAEARNSNRDIDGYEIPNPPEIPARSPIGSQSERPVSSKEENDAYNLAGASSNYDLANASTEELHIQVNRNTNDLEDNSYEPVELQAAKLQFQDDDIIYADDDSEYEPVELQAAKLQSQNDDIIYADADADDEYEPVELQAAKLQFQDDDIIYADEEYEDIYEQVDFGEGKAASSMESTTARADAHSSTGITGASVNSSNTNSMKRIFGSVKKAIARKLSKSDSSDSETNTTKAEEHDSDAYEPVTPSVVGSNYDTPGYRKSATPPPLPRRNSIGAQSEEDNSSYYEDISGSEEGDSSYYADISSSDSSDSDTYEPITPSVVGNNYDTPGYRKSATPPPLPRRNSIGAQSEEGDNSYYENMSSSESEESSSNTYEEMVITSSTSRNAQESTYDFPSTQGNRNEKSKLSSSAPEIYDIPRSMNAGNSIYDIPSPQGHRNNHSSSAPEIYDTPRSMGAGNSIYDVPNPQGHRNNLSSSAPEIYDTPSSLGAEENIYDVPSPQGHRNNLSSSAPEIYDTPRNIGAEEIIYDVPSKPGYANSSASEIYDTPKNRATADSHLSRNLFSSTEMSVGITNIGIDPDEGTSSQSAGNKEQLKESTKIKESSPAKVAAFKKIILSAKSGASNISKPVKNIPKKVKDKLVSLTADKEIEIQDAVPSKAAMIFMSDSDSKLENVAGTSRDRKTRSTRGFKSVLQKVKIRSSSTSSSDESSNDDKPSTSKPFKRIIGSVKSSMGNINLAIPKIKRRSSSSSSSSDESSSDNVPNTSKSKKKNPKIKDTSFKKTIRSLKSSNLGIDLSMLKIKRRSSSSASISDESSSDKIISTEKSMSSIRKRILRLFEKQPSNREIIELLLNAEDEFLTTLDRSYSNLSLNCVLLATAISDLEKSVKLSDFYLSAFSKMEQELTSNGCNIDRLRSVMSTACNNYSAGNLEELKDKFYSELEKRQQEVKLSAEEIKIAVDSEKDVIGSHPENQSTRKKQRKIESTIEKISQIASTVSVKSTLVREEISIEISLLENSTKPLVAILTETRIGIITASKLILSNLMSNGLDKDLASEVKYLLSEWEKNIITKEDDEMSIASILLEDALKARKALSLLIKAKRSLDKS
ncbi:hypothetical protein Ark11_1492 [Candidatus Ichthyocystis hellenicum]|uniref:Uncharacterized protein n=1 Tax=Candidatus Ichthyocystis hellenicum TaxID=1561003 RepID=A0A0S4M5T7_9BURK|nr:hypothetical protein [Candidatus Ichthyocystis hellenicum]CUT18290.1 hypothetical protein Ark11_1492 [Candidatus Ichthyocystis hellenicum]